MLMMARQVGRSKGCTSEVCRSPGSEHSRVPLQLLTTPTRLSQVTQAQFLQALARSDRGTCRPRARGSATAGERHRTPCASRALRVERERLWVVAC